jgi:F0F1-type ATP synthase delta subunit
MTLAHSYARALFDLVSARAGKESEYLKNLVEALRRRGHEQLLRRIFSEYKTLMLKEERTKAHTTVTPEAERTRVLLELYRKMITKAHE